MSQVKLSSYDNRWYRPGRSVLWRSFWHLSGSPLLRSSLITSSAFRVHLLRAFGARIGSGVVMRQPFKVKFPWHLTVGNDCWIGEDCWIDNLADVTVGNDVCISQGAYLCTGNHDWTDPAFGLRVAPIQLEDGSWAGAKCVLTPGSVLSREAIAAAGSVITGKVPERAIYSGNPGVFLRNRVLTSAKTDKAGQGSVS